MTEFRVSFTAIEALRGASNPPVRVSLGTLEVLRGAVPPVRFSSLAVEVLRSTQSVQPTQQFKLYARHLHEIAKDKKRHFRPVHRQFTPIQLYAPAIIPVHRNRLPQGLKVHWEQPHFRHSMRSPTAVMPLSRPYFMVFL